MIHVNFTGEISPDGVNYVVATPDGIGVVDGGTFEQMVAHSNAIIKLFRDNQKPLDTICEGTSKEKEPCLY